MTHDRVFFRCITALDCPQGVQVVMENPQSVRITLRPHPGFTGRVTRYVIKWLHVGNPADSHVDGHKIVNACSPYCREAQVCSTHQVCVQFQKLSFQLLFLK